MHAGAMEIRREIALNTPARNAWIVLGERFGTISEWAAPITASSLAGELGAGAVRTCHIAGFGPVKPGVIKERLVTFDPGAMSFSYESVEGLPGFIRHAANRWSVRAAGERSCVVSTHATLELCGAARVFGYFLGRRMARDGGRVLEELQHQVEQGRPHPRKVEAMALASRRR